MSRSTLKTISTGLDRSHPAFRLYEKAKRLGIWNPSSIDLTQDRKDWLKLEPDEQQLLLHLAALFQAGEEAVRAAVAEGRVREGEAVAVAATLTIEAIGLNQTVEGVLSTKLD